MKAANSLLVLGGGGWWGWENSRNETRLNRIQKIRERSLTIGELGGKYGQRTTSFWRPFGEGPIFCLRLARGGLQI